MRNHAVDEREVPVGMRGELGEKGGEGVEGVRGCLAWLGRCCVAVAMASFLEIRWLIRYTLTAHAQLSTLYSLVSLPRAVAAAQLLLAPGAAHKCPIDRCPHPQRTESLTLSLS